MDSYFNIVRTVETIHPVKKRKHTTGSFRNNKKIRRLGSGVHTNEGFLQTKIKILEKTIHALQQNIIKYQDETNRRLCQLEEQRERR